MTKELINEIETLKKLLADKDKESEQQKEELKIKI
jgi:hypothetical protein